MTTPNERQERRIEEFLRNVEAHGAESVSRHGLTIQLLPENRPGRGHDLRVAYVDADVVAYAFIDVYGNGNELFGEVNWICQDEDWCDECQAANDEEKDA